MYYAIIRYKAPVPIKGLDDTLDDLADDQKGHPESSGYTVAGTGKGWRELWYLFDTKAQADKFRKAAHVMLPSDVKTSVRKQEEDKEAA